MLGGNTRSNTQRTHVVKGGCLGYPHAGASAHFSCSKLSPGGGSSFRIGRSVHAREWTRKNPASSVVGARSARSVSAGASSTRSAIIRHRVPARDSGEGSRRVCPSHECWRSRVTTLLRGTTLRGGEEHLSLERWVGKPFGTLILPVYNAEAFLNKTLSLTREWLAARPELWELLVIDDGSSDASAEILDRFLAENPGDAIARTRFRENRGKGFAIRKGLGMARGTYAIFTDCDLAYAIENTERVVDELEAGRDVVVACRVLPESRYVVSPSFFSYLYTRHLMGRAFNLLCRLVTLPGILDSQAGLKGFRVDRIRPVLPHLVLD